MCEALIASCVSKGAVRQQWETLSSLGWWQPWEDSVLASSPFQSPSSPRVTHGSWMSPREEAPRCSEGALARAHSPKRSPAQTVSVCKFHMRIFYFFKANAFILLAIVSIVAFRIRWFDIRIQRSWGGFVYLFVVKSLTSWSDICTTPQSKGIRQVTCLPFLINTNNSLFPSAPYSLAH